MWCDLAVDIGPIGSESFRYQYSDFESVAEEHAKNQRGDFCVQNNYQHLKLISPWYMVCKNNIKWFYTDVVWNDTNLNCYRVLPGVVNYKFVSGTHVNIIFKRENFEQQVFIPYKKPIAQIIPLTDKTIKIKHHLVDILDLNKKLFVKNLGIKFLNRVSEAKKELKCPMKHN